MSIRKGSALIILFTLGFIISLGAQPRDRRLRVNGQEFRHQPRPSMTPSNQNSCPQNEHRTFDGTCNNRSTGRTEWGATDITLRRVMLEQYGASDPFNDMGGEDRASARMVSNLLSAQDRDTPSSHGLSSFVFTWGQFLDHDISLTPEGESEYVPISIPDNDPLFQNDIPFLRSEVHEGTGEEGPRQQSNLITSWIDGSNIYGSDSDRANWLRTFSNGKLKTSSGNFLPYNTIDGELESDIDLNAPSMAGDRGGTTKTIVAGDIRAAEQPGLTSLHTLFVREHNRICDNLTDNNNRSDEEIYQLARKQVGALIQNITYQEFLPSLGVRIGRYRDYDPRVQPDISNLFATAAYRLGHTMVTDELLILDDNCNPIDDGILTLLEGFFNPAATASVGIDAILKGLSVQVQNEVDPKIIDNLRNFLFGNPADPNAIGLDLASLNIQRGRDHGLADYNTIREKYTGSRASNFSEITSDETIQTALSEAYNGDINNIDPWVGMLSEDLLRDASVGRTLHNIMAVQFSALRDGDSFYFENDRALDRRTRDRIKRTQLSEVIERNTGLTNLDNNVFIASGCNRATASNRAVNVDTDLDLVKMSISPNPTSDLVNVLLNTNDTNQTLQIINSNGALLDSWNLVPGHKETSTINIDLSSYSDGLYVVRLVSASHSTTKKLMIIRD